MEIRHIRAFITLADELHFGRTASRLHVAQSAVSNAIKSLEDEVGARLFARTKRRVDLTPAGQHFLEHSTTALVELERAAVSARKAAAGETGRLMLRFTLMSALTVLPRVVAKFRIQHPDVQLSIQPGGTTEQFQALAQGHCDIGFVSIKKEQGPFASEVVERSALVVVLPSRHALATRKRIGLRELAHEPFVFLSQAGEPDIRVRFQRRCVAAGFEPQIVVEVEQAETLLAFVAAGVGISCAPALVRRLGFEGVVTVPLAPEIVGGISAVWNANALSPAGQRFLAILRHERDAPQPPPVPASTRRTSPAKRRRPR